MKKIIKKIIKKILNSVSDKTELLAIGAMLSKQQYLMNSTNINDYEFKIFSQWGDDGIIQYLIKNIKIKNEIFIEFGVEDYQESNTRFLMMNDNWAGFVMDGSDYNMKILKNQKWYWKYHLTQKAVFIDLDNIQTLLKNTGFTNIGLFHIDLDGNDYHILEAIDLTELNPSIIIMEYNSVFGLDRLISVPYDKNFNRTKAHYSNLFYGASLPAINNLAIKKGYSLVGCNKAGNNAYFVRKDLLNERVKELSLDKAFKDSNFREGRNENYSLSYLSGKDKLNMLIKDKLEVLNIETNQLEQL